MERRKRKLVMVCAVVGLLGLVSAATGFAAEATRIKRSDVPRTGVTCSYPSSPALPLGLIAAAALAIAQGIINVVAGCICCKRNVNRSDTNWTVALITFIVSWVTFIIAFLLLLGGAAWNVQRDQEEMYYGEHCYVIKPGVFTGGALFSLVSVCSGIVYYVCLSTSKTVQTSWVGPYPNNQGIAMGQPVIPPPQSNQPMGQPVIPPQSNQPVFVHEDTYNRQQFP